MKASRSRVYYVIDTERSYQQAQWPGHEDQDNPLTVGEFLVLLDVYVAKAKAEWTLEPKPELKTLQIMRKIAAIAVNCMEQHGAFER